MELAYFMKMLEQAIEREEETRVKNVWSKQRNKYNIVKKFINKLMQERKRHDINL